MPIHESLYFVLPDFDDLIARLAKIRPEVEADYDRYHEKLRTIGHDVTKDARLTAFAHLGGLIDSTNLAFTFMNKQLLPLDNPWWEETYKPPFQPFDSYQRSVNINRFNNAFVKSGFLIKLFSEIESTFRILLRRLDPSACNAGTGSFYFVHEALKSQLTSFPSDSDDLIKVLRLSRNTVHNNGVYFNKSGNDDQVMHKGTTYCFRNGKPIDFVNWEWLIERLDDVRKLFASVISDANIIEITDLIADPFAMNRKTVTK
jgi:hypothetical protein